MPGTPDPVLGSEAVTLLVAAVAGAVVALAPVAYADRLPGPLPVAVAGGVAYGVLSVGLWAGVRVWTGAFANYGSRGAFAGWLLLGAGVLAVQGAVPLYLHARWGLLSPLAGLFGLTTLVLFVFLRVRGESDPLALYALFFGPVLIAGLLLLSGAEYGLRRLLAADRS